MPKQEFIPPTLTGQPEPVQASAGAGNPWGGIAAGFIMIVAAVAVGVVILMAAGNAKPYDLSVTGAVWLGVFATVLLCGGVAGGVGIIVSNIRKLEGKS